MEKQEVSILKIKTLHFGEIEIENDKIFHFPDGLLGFEDFNSFVLINHEETAPLRWLISIDDPTIGFPLINPWMVDIKYNPGKNVDLEKEAAFVVITLGNKERQMTANMKAPLVLGVETRIGRQIVMSSDKYSTKQPVIHTTSEGV
ncbi:MAG: flagellar assembly protein FliW [Candidatus Kapaibacterium sp.]|nr:flagellar assembly protein FliW [Ignavibacteriota bacterium]